MNTDNIKGEGAGLINAIGAILLVLGLISGIVAFFTGMSSDIGESYIAFIGIGICIGSVWIFAIARNLASINTNLERLCYYKKIEIKRLEAEVKSNIPNSADGSTGVSDEEKTLEEYGITKTFHGTYLFGGAKHYTLNSAIEHAKKDIANRNK